MRNRWLVPIVVATTVLLAGCAASQAAQVPVASAASAASSSSASSGAPNPTGSASASPGLEAAPELGSTVTLPGAVLRLETVHPGPSAAVLPGPRWSISQAVPSASSVVVAWADTGCARVTTAAVVETSTTIVIDLVRRHTPIAQACTAAALVRLGRVRLDAPIAGRTLEEHVADGAR